MTLLARLVAAATQMRSHLRRTGLAMLTTVVGIWAITTTVAVGEMGKAAALRQAELTQGRPATLSLGLLDINNASVQMDQSTRSRINDRLRRFGVEDYSPVATSTIDVMRGSISVTVEAQGVEPAFSNVRLQNIVAGIWLSPGAVVDRAPLVVANSELVTALRMTPSAAVGATLRLATLTPVTARIIGVVNSTGPEAPAIYLPIASLESWGVAPAGVTYTYLIHVDPTAVGAVESVLSYEIGTWGDGLHVTWTREDHIDEITRALVIFQLALTLIAGISLFTGGLGILNLGLVTVRQRVREFGQWRVFGATDSDIFTMVLLETLVVSLTGGLVAVACSFLVLTLLPSWTTFTPFGQTVTGSFPVGAAALGLAVSAVVGLVAGLWPAWAATRTDVVEAIQQ